MHSRFVENHPIRILEDGPLIFEGVLAQLGAAPASAAYLSSTDVATSASVTALGDLWRMEDKLGGEVMGAVRGGACACFARLVSIAWPL
jgi:hypothetical protein